MTYNDLLSNPITEAVAKIDGILPTLDADKIASLEANAELDASDWLALGNKASLALAMGFIDANVAQTLYSIHNGWSTATLAQRTVYLMTMSELLPRLR